MKTAILLAALALPTAQSAQAPSGDGETTPSAPSPVDPAPDSFEEFSAICLDMLHAPSLASDEDGGVA